MLNYLALLMVICGAIAVALSVAGIYSVMAYAMSQRTHEIGIRLALGATPRDVLYAMLRQAGTLTAIGLGIGVVLAAVFGRLLASALYGLVALDPLTFVGATDPAVVSLGAAYVPDGVSCASIRPRSCVCRGESWELVKLASRQPTDGRGRWRGRARRSMVFV